MIVIVMMLLTDINSNTDVRLWWHGDVDDTDDYDDTYCDGDAANETVIIIAITTVIKLIIKIVTLVRFEITI